MSTVLDLHDIQGPTMWAYPALGFVKARNVVFDVKKGEHGRAFILALLPYVTSSVPWKTDASERDGVKCQRPRRIFLLLTMA